MTKKQVAFFVAGALAAAAAALYKCQDDSPVLPAKDKPTPTEADAGA